MRGLGLGVNSILPLLVFFLVQSALAETKSYLVQFPAGHVVNFPKGDKDSETKKDSLTNSKYIITHTEGKSESSIKGVVGAVQVTFAVIGFCRHRIMRPISRADKNL